MEVLLQNYQKKTCYKLFCTLVHCTNCCFCYVNMHFFGIIRDEQDMNKT